MFTLLALLAFAASWTRHVAAHTVIVYPGWRGDNLHSNGTNADGSIIPGSLGIDFDPETGQRSFPYGMQWMYPCGGLPTSQNRTKWPVTGGAVAVQPGWFSGHATAFFYINLGLGTEPLNMSHPMVPVFQITGPSKLAYNGSFCLPQVPLPANITVNVGDNATIQVVETAVHGAALYSCVDITFAEPEDVAEVNETNCVNTTEPGTQIGFNTVFAASSLSNAAPRLLVADRYLTLLPAIAGVLIAGLWL